MENSPRAAELTTLLESRISHFYTHFQVDGEDFFAVFLGLCLILSVVICLMDRPRSHRRKGKAVATTSAGGHNADDDDERKNKEADEAFRRLQIRKAQKGISGFLHDLTKVDHPFPRSPSLQDWLTVTERVCDAIYSERDVRPGIRLALINALYTKLTMYERNSEDFPQFVNEMSKFLSEHK